MGVLGLTELVASAEEPGKGREGGRETESGGREGEGLIVASK